MHGDGKPFDEFKRWVAAELKSLNESVEALAEALKESETANRARFDSLSNTIEKRNERY